MNPQSSSRNRSVFVGNIPYESTEEQLKEIFSQAGPVVSFRLVYDKDTGKPRGYGFVEYKDSHSAFSAIRNLNGYEINARTLRVSFSEQDVKGQEGVPSSVTGANMQNDISKVLDGMSPSQLYEIMVQMKGLIQKKPEQVQLLLYNNPQLAYALLQAQVILGIINSNDAQQLHLHAQQQSQQPQPQPQLPTLPNYAPNYLTSYAPYIQPTLPMIPQPAPVSADALANLDDEKKKLLDQVLKLTPEQIEKLAPHEQQQILQLRQAMGVFRR